MQRPQRSYCFNPNQTHSCAGGTKPVTKGSEERSKQKVCSKPLAQAAKKLLKNAWVLEELKRLSGPGVCIQAHILRSARHLLSRMPGKGENNGSHKTEGWDAADVSAPIRAAAASEQMGKLRWVQVMLNRALERIYYRVTSAQPTPFTWQKAKISPARVPKNESWQMCRERQAAVAAELVPPPQCALLCSCSTLPSTLGNSTV